MILFINACVREESRTRRLAAHLLSMMDGKVEEVYLPKIHFPLADAAFLKRRDALIEQNDFSDDLFDWAKQFAAADEIVIAAPFWDLSFPASLKQYIEQINVRGITFAYTEEGRPYGMCHARKLYYITSAGGIMGSEEYGYGYIKALAHTFYGIPKTFFYKAEGLDIYGADVEAILREAESRMCLE